MNVAFNPWIPVVTLTGERFDISLSEVFTEGEQYADFAVRPHERVALMRLFLCVAHAALKGPKDYTEWCVVPKRLPEAVKEYLTDWKDSFELFHKEKPWLQIAELKKDINGCDGNLSDWIPVSKMNFSYATGENTTLFDHEGANKLSRKISLNEVILSLLTFQSFTVGGLIGQTFWNGKRCGELANPKKENGPVKSSDGPCSPQSMIHAFLRGKNLIDTIHLNLPSYDCVKLSYNRYLIGVPIWEKSITSANDSVGKENATTTYIGRLVPISRFIRIHPSAEIMLIGDGLKYPNYSSGFTQEPSATVIVRTVRKQQERTLLSYQPSKGIWRQLASIVVKRNTDGIGGPLSLHAISDNSSCDLFTMALKRDKATIEDTVESVYHIPGKLLLDDGYKTYEQEVHYAETISSKLGWAVESYRVEIDSGWQGKLKSAGPAKGALKAKLHSMATLHYWTTVEKNLSLLFTHIEAKGTDMAIPTQDAWRKMIFSAACESYRVACGQETPRQIRAFAKGFQRLIKNKEKPDSEIYVSQTQEEEV